jgi:hypothetical protein
MRQQCATLCEEEGGVREYLTHVVGEGKVLKGVLMLKIEKLLRARDHLAVLVEQKVSVEQDSADEQS